MLDRDPLPRLTNKTGAKSQETCLIATHTRAWLTKQEPRDMLDRYPLRDPLPWLPTLRLSLRSAFVAPFAGLGCPPAPFHQLTSTKQSRGAPELLREEGQQTVEPRKVAWDWDADPPCSRAA